MKIGIVTYHRSHNYGALLQAIATRIYLEHLGHHAYYVDYAPKAHLDMYSAFSLSEMIRRRRQAFGYLKDCMKYYRYRKKRIISFEAFIEKYILPYVCPCTESFDLVIYGSDQIWRKQRWFKDYDPFYFAKNNLNAKHHVSYAASMGRIPQTELDKKKIYELLQNMERISVREDNLKELLSSLGIDATVCLDPTLLISQNLWNRLFGGERIVKEPYVFFYDLFPNSFREEEIRTFTKNQSKRLIIVHGDATQDDTTEDLYSVPPDVFLNLLKYADFVFTSSFHGLVFSILYNKQFVASFGDNSGRASSLLSKVGLPDRLLPPMTIFPSHFVPINYIDVDLKLNILREQSASYIESIING